jgi:thymidylate synthase
MLQEIVARSVSAELGTYKQAIGSMHLYVKDIGPAKRFLNEGWQQTKPIMPTMPEEDPWEAVAILLEAESIIRNRGEFREERLHQINTYWADLIRLLQVLAAKKLRDPDAIHAVREKMSSSIYFPFIDRAIRQTLASKPLESSHG